MPLASEQEIQSAYARSNVAANYVAQRFTSALHRLLHTRQVAAIQGVINRTKPAHILEIAAGPARLTRDLRTSGNLVCLEYNEGMIKEGSAVCPNVHWIRGNGFQLPFSEGFDLVYTFRFIRHFQLADRQRLYAEIRRVLRPGGSLILDAVNERISGPLRKAHPEEYPIYDELYRPADLRRELAEAGFEVLELQPVQKRLGWQSKSQVLVGPRIDWLNRLFIHLLEWLPARDGLEWIVTCRRV
jgi:ubiquinone/menaquinone biosynthesis C-methylase UbiE